jgi:hypothetical protein
MAVVHARRSGVDAVIVVGIEFGLFHGGRPSTLPVCGNYEAASVTVLVVDDDPAARGVVVDLLSSQGLRALTASSSYQALQILGDQHVDVLLTDIVCQARRELISPPRPSDCAQR